MKPEQFLTGIRQEITPKKAVRSAVWKRIESRTTLPQAHAFSRIRISLLPSPEFKEHIRRRVLLRLEPIHTATRSSQIFKWSAALALVALLVRVSPMLFIASSTVAESEVLLVPTRGEVLVSVGDLWQPVEGEMELKPGMMLRTRDGEASIILHDDGVIRLDEETSVKLQDISDRLDSGSPEIFPSLTLLTGRIWVQGLLPPRLRGITVATSNGHITVNEGSVSVSEDMVTDVDVYDRSATITKNGEETYLASGERTQLSPDSVLLVKKIPAKWFQYTWANQNLQRDAVHRHEIAQLQHERHVAKAGILPTSPLYRVKRFAEEMDVWMTFNQKNRVEKQLQVAETRLNEAAALIHNEEQVHAALDEYTAMLEYIAKEGNREGSLAEFLVQRALAESSAQLSAALPGDDAYVIKKRVLQTSATVSDTVSETDANGTLLLDGLAVMVRAADEGKTEMVRSVWSDLHPYVAGLEDEDKKLDPLMYKEAQTLLTFLATSLHVAAGRGVAIDPELLDDFAAYLPPPPATEVVTLSEEEIMQIVQNIRDNIFVYSMTQSRINQFTAELRALQNNPDLGRILRRLAQALPDGPEHFPDRVYKKIVELRWETVSQ